MRSPLTRPPARGRRMLPKWEKYIIFWANWRESIAGVLIVIGLCGPFTLPSFLPVQWWMLLPFAVAGGLLRQQRQPQVRAVLVPLWSVLIVFLLFILYAVSFHPLQDYGLQKTKAFIIGAVLAYIGGRRQAPLTPELLRGIRWGLIGTLVLSVLSIYMNRDLYLYQQQYGLEALNQSVSLTALPLVLAMGVCGLLPRHVTPAAVSLSGALFLAGAVLEVLIRSRFHAVMMVVLAMMIVLGPPWKHIFWRVIASCLLVVIALGVYVNVLPLLGDSFQYFTWLDPTNIAGRGPIWQVAVRGFLDHPLGQGIGSFAQADFYFKYPHNMILEAAYEMGILGLLSMLAMYLAVMRRVYQLWVSPPHRVLGAMTILVFLHVLKCGDISTIAFHWVFLYLLIVATPLAASWPLVRGRQAE